MEEYFFSEKNIGDLTKKLILNLELSEKQINRSVVLKCKKIILNHMNMTFEKYGKNKPQNMPIAEFIEKLNKKSINDCIKIINNKSNNTSVKYQEPPQIPRQQI